MSDIKKLTQQVVKFRDARDWKQFHNPKDAAIGLALEAAEVLEHFHWKNDKEMKEHLATRKEEVGEELADILYWVFLMAYDFDIDLGEAFTKKMEKNAKKYPVEKAKGRHVKYTEL
jgi:NTP pyrophosphatase (non-canonical NTP hydrolase)